MLVRLRNDPRDYAWGSRTLIASLEGRAPADQPEAEVWFGDHPGDPATVPDGRALGEWLAEAPGGAPTRLPYLLKLLAAASHLSIQVHPSKRQAEAGFAREEAAGVPRDAGERLYRDDNHKPELIVAVSETFTALAGLRDLDESRRLVAALGPAGEPLAARLAGEDAEAALRGTIAWVLSGAADAEVGAVVAALPTASDSESVAEFAAEFAVARRIAAVDPGDPGVVVALLMNLVFLRRGEALYLPAGVLHAYVEGLGVEIMAASDNVMRGGLTPKHVDVAELVQVLDARPRGVPRIEAVPAGDGVHRFDPGVSDFALLHARVGEFDDQRIALDGVAVALATVGEMTVRGGATGESVMLGPGQAVLVTPDEGAVAASGSGELFIAVPGRAPASSAS